MLTSIGALQAERAVKPHISLKYIVVLIKASGHTGSPEINWSATDLKKETHENTITETSKHNLLLNTLFSKVWCRSWSCFVSNNCNELRSEHCT